VKQRKRPEQDTFLGALVRLGSRCLKSLDQPEPFDVPGTSLLLVTRLARLRSWKWAG
jgi:hypothetical protein